MVAARICFKTLVLAYRAANGSYRAANGSGPVILKFIEWKDGAVWTWHSKEYVYANTKKQFNNKPKQPAGGDAREGNIPFYTQLAAFEVKPKSAS